MASSSSQHSSPPSSPTPTAAEPSQAHRQTLSFYSYQQITGDLEQFRHQLYTDLNHQAVLGRVYIAAEGVNGQVSVHQHNFAQFSDYLNQLLGVSAVRIAIEEGTSFTKLTVKLKSRLVADGGLPPLEQDQKLIGQHVDAQQWHSLMDDTHSITIDVRNDYEHEVGHFQGAHLMPVSTFREQLQQMPTTFESYKNHKILLYCTGGIRCEKTSVMLLKAGFKEVYQLKGGIIEYKKQIDQLGIKSRFLGKNFVFDRRLSERITDDVLSQCYNCGATSDHMINCAWTGCNTLFVQCDSCGTIFDHCCSQSCADKHALSPEEQKAIAQNFPAQAPRFKSRSQPLHPEL